MFSDELLEKILMNKRVIHVPIGYQSAMIRGIEETLEKEHYDVVEHKQGEHTDAV